MEGEMLMDEVVRLLKQGCSVTLRVTGKSMCPFLMPTRDKVLLCPALSFRIGDIVLVGTATKEFVLHRIYEMGTDTLLLMGDGNLSQMEVCSRDVVLGKAVKIIRNGHEVDCSSRMERFLSLTWMRLRPFRRGLLVVCRFFLNGLDDKK